MTCIIGWIDDKNKKVYMGSDSSITTGWSNKYTLTQPKVFTKQEKYRGIDMLIGASGAWRDSQIVKYNFEIPEHHTSKMDSHEYLCTKFVKALKAAFSECERQTNNDGAKEAGSGSGLYVLVAYDGRLFNIREDFSVMETTEKFLCIGNGGEIATGACASLEADSSLTTEKKILKALEIAARFKNGVAPPFAIQSIPINTV